MDEEISLVSDRAVANEILNDRYFGLRVGVRRCKVFLPDSGDCAVEKVDGQNAPARAGV